MPKNNRILMIKAFQPQDVNLAAEKLIEKQQNVVAMIEHQFLLDILGCCAQLLLSDCKNHVVFSMVVGVLREEAGVGFQGSSLMHILSIDEGDE
uniref:Uncharacterized protein n=1 Tax=Romanomermis culicivorax TaxID=13658 RepID=A0A915IUJ1_ROMCU